MKWIKNTATTRKEHEKEIVRRMGTFPALLCTGSGQCVKGRFVPAIDKWYAEKSGAPYTNDEVSHFLVITLPDGGSVL